MTLDDANDYLRKFGSDIISLSSVQFVAVTKTENKNLYSIKVLINSDKDIQTINLFREAVIIEAINNGNEPYTQISPILGYYNTDNVSLVSFENSIEYSMMIKKSRNLKEIVNKQSQIINKYTIRHNQNQKIEPLNKIILEEKIKYKIREIEKSNSYNDNVQISSTNKEFKLLNSKQQLFSLGGHLIKNSRSSDKSGTLGGVVRLSNNKFYAITNWHTIMFDEGKFGDTIIFENEKNEEIQIGPLKWARFDTNYDLALVEITNPLIIKLMKNNKGFKKPAKPDFEMDVTICGAVTSHPEYCKIYSNNAYVKVDNRIFKNQIITEKSISEEGDSGSILVNKKNDAIGLIFSGDKSNYSLANPLHKIFEKNLCHTVIQNELIEMNEFKNLKIVGILNDHKI